MKFVSITNEKATSKFHVLVPSPVRRGVKGLWCVKNADSTKSLPRKGSH